MIRKTRHAHTNYEMAIPFCRQADKHDGCIRCTSEGFMDLSVEKLYYNDSFGNPVYSFCHWGKQNGDAMRDPDLTFSINAKEETIIPLTFQNDYLRLYQEVFKEAGGKTVYSRSLLTDLDKFFWNWLKNIYNQGFKPDIFRRDEDEEAEQEKEFTLEEFAAAYC